MFLGELQFLEHVLGRQSESLVVVVVPDGLVLVIFFGWFGVVEHEFGGNGGPFSLEFDLLLLRVVGMVLVLYF